MTITSETVGQIRLITLHRPEKLNAMNRQMVSELQEEWRSFHADPHAEVAIVTGAGRAFCAGEDLVESAAAGVPDLAMLTESDHLGMNASPKPVIAAINGFCLGGGFLMVEKSDLRIAVPGAIFEVSEAKRWLLGGWSHGLAAGLPHALAVELAFGFDFSAERLFETGFINRLASPEQLVEEAMRMAEHLLELPPASRVNTTHMMRIVRPAPEAQWSDLAKRLHGHGARADLVESRRAFAEKRRPDYIGWEDPGDRFALPSLPLS